MFHIFVMEMWIKLKKAKTKNNIPSWLQKCKTQSFIICKKKKKKKKKKNKYHKTQNFVFICPPPPPKKKQQNKQTYISFKIILDTLVGGIGPIFIYKILFLMHLLIFYL